MKAPSLRARLAALYLFLFVLNLGTWAAALIEFRQSTALIGVAFLIYGLGMRHAVDADHIAVIDNVTRKLLQERHRPVTVGFFFAIGHSTVVFLVAVAVASMTATLSRIQRLPALTGILGTLLSASFLVAIAIVNLVIFLSIYRTFRRVRATGVYVEEDLDLLMARGGLLVRIFKPLFALVSRSWHMLLLGAIFGLGFDTATEIAMFSVSASQATHGRPLTDVLIFPVLFAAGMSLVDSTDGVLMLGAYEWAFFKPMRKLYYNMTITLISVLVALLIGGVEVLGVVLDRWHMAGFGWACIGLFSHSLNNCGFAIIALFLFAWGVSYVNYRFQRLDDVEIHMALKPNGN